MRTDKLLGYAAGAAMLMMTGFILAVATVSVANAGQKNCSKGQVYRAQTNDCVWRAPAHNDFGTGNANPKTIQVKVCISWLHLLNGNGGSKWWGLRLTSWPGDQYKPVYEECKLQNVPLGHRVYNDPSCYPGWRYATEPIMKAGATYYLKRWKRI